MEKFIITKLKNLKKNFFYYKNDTELLVNMHEDYEPIEIPKKIDGMFAYCTYNKETKYILHLIHKVKKNYFILTMMII